MLYIDKKTKLKGDYILLLDEIQDLDVFVGVLNGCLCLNKFDIFVTGSNFKFLSSQVDTALRDYEKNHKTYTHEEITKKLR